MLCNHNIRSTSIISNTATDLFIMIVHRRSALLCNDTVHSHKVYLLQRQVSLLYEDMNSSEYSLFLIFSAYQSLLVRQPANWIIPNSVTPTSSCHVISTDCHLSGPRVNALSLQWVHSSYYLDHFPYVMSTSCLSWVFVGFLASCLESFHTIVIAFSIRLVSISTSFRSSLSLQILFLY